MAAASEAFYSAFQPGPLGQRLCIWHSDPAQAPRALVVHVHAFAEEMNKSRRMVALQSRALAAAGFAVLQADLLGCGDSAGEFSHASWSAWLDDVSVAITLAKKRHAECWPELPASSLWLWGQRAGALLAAEAACRLNEPVNLMLWQPTPSGKSVLKQFLRLESAAALLSKGGERGLARAALTRGEVAEVAGYELSPALATGLEASRLQAPQSAGCLVWLDVAATEAQEPTPVTAAALKAWHGAGWHTRHQTVVGPAFWQTTEIEDAPSLIETTIEALSSALEAAAEIRTRPSRAVA